MGRLFVLGWFPINTLKQRSSTALLGSVPGLTCGREGKEVGMDRGGETLGHGESPLRPQLTTLGLGTLGWPLRAGAAAQLE